MEAGPLEMTLSGGWQPFLAAPVGQLEVSPSGQWRPAGKGKIMEENTAARRCSGIDRREPGPVLPGMPRISPP
ncbi:MAG TPA: hypothetical protein VJ550_09070 [Geomonas sp.]|nr:hypothetical protein [Geomonas sp.]